MRYISAFRISIYKILNVDLRFSLDCVSKMLACNSKYNKYFGSGKRSLINKYRSSDVCSHSQNGLSGDGRYDVVVFTFKQNKYRTIYSVITVPRFSAEILKGCACISTIVIKPTVLIEFLVLRSSQLICYCFRYLTSIFAK